MNVLLEKCNLCPRNCGVNRYKNVGFCGASDKIKIAYYSLHQWEEPVISGKNGSGTIFFSYCNMKCLFCQNLKLSKYGYGKEISGERFRQICLDLQNKGAHNINLVTPTHYVPQIIDELSVLKRNDLKIPIVYNTGSYENVSTIKLLNNIVDIYLADLKYYDNILGKRYSSVDNYFNVACNAIDEMYNQVGKFVIKNGLMKKGIIVRILILPGHIDDSCKILNYLYNKYGDNIFISIMNQYTPCNFIPQYENLNRKITEEEYDYVINYACDLGIKNAFIQTGDTADESFIPNFDINVI